MGIEETPWDKAVFGMPTFEITGLAEEDFALALHQPGHYTVKIDPLADKRMLHECGFYYCDTLIEPHCTREEFRFFEHEDFRAMPGASMAALLEICHGAFSHGRFHRDFNLDRDLADLRYDRWLESLHNEGRVLGLYRKEELAGFVAFSGSCLVLHAMGQNFRGRGYGKYLWSAACKEIFGRGVAEITSSISASNLAALNLYASLGFRFGKAVDVYHLLVK